MPKLPLKMTWVLLLSFENSGILNLYINLSEVSMVSFDHQKPLQILNWGDYLIVQVKVLLILNYILY